MASTTNIPARRYLDTEAAAIYLGMTKDAVYVAVARLFRHGTHTKAAAWLSGLCLSKIIREVKKGGPQTNRARRYRYLHPLDE